MRSYKDRDNVQAKSYYKDRFWVPPKLEKMLIEKDEVFKKDVESLKSNFKIKDAYIQASQLVIYVNPKDIKDIMLFFKDELLYTQLSELSAIDWLEKLNQFEIFYQLLSMSKRKRVRVKYFIDESSSIISVESIFKSANWAEREMYDMFGIKAKNHPYLRRILMPDDWVGYPLRKTYPLHGDENASWYEVDTIFGKESRDIIGAEERDSAKVIKNNTKQYSRINHQVPYGQSPSKEVVLEDYQEDGGVLFIKKISKKKTKFLKQRR